MSPWAAALGDYSGILLAHPPASVLLLSMLGDPAVSTGSPFKQKPS